jgi:hypothetical protein
MTVIRFPGARNVPSKVAVSTLLDELTVSPVLGLSRFRLGPARPARCGGWYCLKRAVIWGLVLWLLVTFAKADPVSRSFYNANGSFAGSSVARGNAASFFDHQGRFNGSSVQHGNRTLFYDYQGRFSGSTINTGPRR